MLRSLPLLSNHVVAVIVTLIQGAMHSWRTKRFVWKNKKHYGPCFCEASSSKQEYSCEASLFHSRNFLNRRSTVSKSRCSCNALRNTISMKCKHTEELAHITLAQFHQIIEKIYTGKCAHRKSLILRNSPEGQLHILRDDFLAENKLSLPWPNLFSWLFQYIGWLISMNQCLLGTLTMTCGDRGCPGSRQQLHWTFSFPISLQLV